MSVHMEYILYPEDRLSAGVGRAQHVSREDNSMACVLYAIRARTWWKPTTERPGAMHARMTSGRIPIAVSARAHRTGTRMAPTCQMVTAAANGSRKDIVIHAQRAP
jgi:hypothetical protein